MDLQRRIKEKQKGDNSMGKGKAVLAFAVAAGMAGMLAVPASAADTEDAVQEIKVELADGSGIWVKPSSETEEQSYDVEFTLSEEETLLQVPETVKLYQFDEEAASFVEAEGGYCPGGTYYISLTELLEDADGSDVYWQSMNIMDICIQEMAGGTSSRETAFQIQSGAGQVEEISFPAWIDVEEQMRVPYIKVEFQEDPSLFREPLSFDFSVSQTGSYMILGDKNAVKLPQPYDTIAQTLTAQYIPQIFDVLAGKALSEGKSEEAALIEAESTQEAAVGGKVSLSNPVILQTASPITLDGAWYEVEGISEGQSFEKDGVISIEAKGSGMNNTTPKENDLRYLPVSWLIEKGDMEVRNGSWQEEGPFTIEESAKELGAGDYMLTVRFAYQTYKASAGGWETTETVTAKTAFSVMGADEGGSSETPDDEKDKGDVNTGGEGQKKPEKGGSDSTEGASSSPKTGEENNRILLAGMLCILSAGAVGVCVYKRKGSR